jgi:excisionase family DNA binding protein
MPDPQASEDHVPKESSGDTGGNQRPALRPLLLKVPEACLVLGCSRSKLFALMKSGEITGVMLGPRQRRVAYAECEAYVAGLVASRQSVRGAA